MIRYLFSEIVPGFKPFIMALAPNDDLVIFSSENSLKTSFSNFKYTDVKMGQLLKITAQNHIQELTSLESNKMLMDPFEFIRESHVTTTFNNKSIYTIRRNIGKVQDELSIKICRSRYSICRTRLH